MGDFGASNITNTVLLTDHQKSSTWPMKYKNSDDLMSCIFPTTAPCHIHQKPMVQPAVQEYVAIIILGVLPIRVLCTDHC